MPGLKPESLPDYLRDSNLRTSDSIEDNFMQIVTAVDPRHWAASINGAGCTVLVDTLKRKVECIVAAVANATAFLSSAAIWDPDENWILDTDVIFSDISGFATDGEFFFGLTATPGDPLAATDFVGFYADAAESANMPLRFVSRISSGAVVNFLIGTELAPDVAATPTPIARSLKIDLRDPANPLPYVDDLPISVPASVTFDDLSSVNLNTAIGVFSAAGEVGTLDIDFARINRDKIA